MCASRGSSRNSSSSTTIIIIIIVGSGDSYNVELARCVFCSAGSVKTAHAVWAFRRDIGARSGGVFFLFMRA